MRKASAATSMKTMRIPQSVVERALAMATLVRVRCTPARISSSLALAPALKFQHTAVDQRRQPHERTDAGLRCQILRVRNRDDRLGCRVLGGADCIPCGHRLHCSAAHSRAESHRTRAPTPEPRGMGMGRWRHGPGVRSGEEGAGRRASGGPHAVDNWLQINGLEARPGAANRRLTLRWLQRGRPSRKLVLQPANEVELLTVVHRGFRVQIAKEAGRALVESIQLRCHAPIVRREWAMR